jgi:Uma2 family endonuclease
VVLDPQRRRITSYRRRTRGYEKRVFRGGVAFTSESLPGLEVWLSEIFG